MNELDRIGIDWLQPLGLPPGVIPFDAHTHLGSSDPDGYRQSPDELIAGLDAIGARALTFPMHEPGGYPPANDAVIETSRGSGGRLACLARIDPRADPIAEARRCLDSGAAGIKFHPRAERFGLDAAGVDEIVELAAERRAPVLIHAGRGIPALGRHAVELADRHRGARLILAHAAVSDLAWIWRDIGARRNLFVDTSWWNPTDMTALFGLVPAGRIVWASDSPYGRPALSLATHMRYALAAGVGPEGLEAILAGNIERILAGEDPIDPEPAPGLDGAAQPLPSSQDPILSRVVSHLTSAITAIASGGDAAESLSLAELACAVGEGSAAPACAAVLGLLERAEGMLGSHEGGRPLPEGTQLVMHAIAVAATPGVAMPELEAAPAPTRESAERLDSLGPH